MCSICDALDLTEQNCAQIDSITYNPPQLPWIITTETAVAGGASLRSAVIGSNSQTCIVLGLTLPANSVISVAGRTSTDSDFDQLQIHADELRLDTLSAPTGETDRNWRQQSYFLPTAISTLSWCYTRDGFFSGGADAVWIDNLSFGTSGISYQSRICDALDLTAEHCTMIESVRYEPPQLLWVITTETAVAGGASLRSAGIGNDQQSCLVLALSLPVNSVVTVSGRTSSEGNFDQLLITADELRIDTISAPTGETDRNWRQESYFLPAAISTLRWCYTKDSITRLGVDTAWIDNLSFSTSNISYQSRICDALDLTNNLCSQIQSIRYEPPQLLWVITSATAAAGGSSLRSATASRSNPGTCAVFELTLPANAFITVSGRTRSEGGLNQLQFDADELRLDTISAPFEQSERDWMQESYFLPAAISTLRWCYVKGDRSREGDDAAWIDNLSFGTSDISYQSRICDALDLTARNCSQIQSISYEPPQLLWVITSATAVAGGSSLRSASIADNRQSCLALELSLPAGFMLSVAGRTSSQGGADQLQIDADKLRIDTISAEPGQIERDWRQQSYLLSTAISTLSWCYSRDFSFGQGQNAVWIDNLDFGTEETLYQHSICDALDLTEQNCAQIDSITYNPPQLPWIITTETAVAGGASLRSAVIGDNSQTCVVLGLTLPANSVISVAGRTSSQGGVDPLQMMADELRLDTLSAGHGNIERPWTQSTYYLPVAISTLSWCYVKDSADSDGEDAVWIDNLSFGTSDIS